MNQNLAHLFQPYVTVHVHPVGIVNLCLYNCNLIGREVENLGVSGTSPPEWPCLHE